jgi:hypothetical protein
MLTKILFTGAVIVLALIVLPRLLSRAKPKSGATPPARTEELIPCPRCGVYRSVFERCDCEQGPSGGN